MKKLLLCMFLLLLSPLAHAQIPYVNCAPNTSCTTSGPSLTGTGDPAWLAFGKINSIFLPGTGVLQFPLNTSNSFLGYLTFIGVNVAQNASLAAYENTFVGWDAGGSGHNTADGLGGGTGITSTALENTCVGWACLTQDTTGQFNTSLGVNTLGHEVNGNQNVAIGTDAERNQVGSSSNVAVGVNACRNGNGTNSNVCIGVNTLQGVNTFPTTTTGTDNVAIGNNSMSNTAMTTANTNVAIGGSAYQNATTGNDNVAVGSFAMTSGTSLAGVTDVGYEAGNAQTSGNDDTYIGNTAGLNALGNYNTIVGSKAFVGATGGGGSQNTAIGYQACLLCTSAAANVVIGYQVASTLLATGANNIVIGTSSAVDDYTASTSSVLNIGNVIRGGIQSISSASLSSCGTSPSMSATATDMSGTITTGSGATGCALTFLKFNGHAPTCLVTARSGTAPAYTTTDNGSNATLVLSTAAASATYDYWCPTH